MGSLRTLRSEGRQVTLAAERLKESIYYRCHKIIETLSNQEKKIAAIIFLRHCCPALKIYDAKNIIEKNQWNLYLGKISEEDIIRNLNQFGYDLEFLETLKRKK